jgi:YD repeat-containing protein
MHVRCWPLAILSALLLATTGCASTSGPIEAPDVRSQLTSQIEQALPDGSVRFDSGVSTPGVPPQRFTGALAWESGMTGEISSADVGESGFTARLTRDAIYSPLPPGFPATSALAGKSWIRQTFADLQQTYGPLGTVIRAVFEQTNPVRNAAILVQARDLQVVGAEDRNGVATTHYSGTVSFHRLVADLRLGLDQATLDALREQFPEDDSHTLDLWVDERGRPVQAQYREPDGTVVTTDYHDYGTPVSVTEPPADQVIDANQLRESFGLPGN